ncbi:MAG TPA: helix-turn-helix domain-containing protein [Nitrososphaera sp.]|jgi:HTH-type transcriptional regulator, sugar sensing transcriptional regulator|nr:helix-turn-helix domain-containing protein [Nitrososphaera sp.]
MMADTTNDIPGSLEEFGLSKYEARAYLTMIGKGSLAVSEIAYYANLPRTKVYQTVKKLEKKKLAVISKQKPLICSAIPPEEAFAEIVNLYDRRVKSMRKIVDSLQKINDESHRPKGSEERRYFILDANSTLERIRTLISNSRSSVTATLDPWGLRLVSQCKASVVRALTAGVRLRMILGSQCIGNENVFQLPDGIELRTAEVVSNLIIIDSSYLVSIDSSNGKAAFFASTDSFAMLQAKNFEEAWSSASEMKYLLDMQPDAAAKAIELIRIVENGLAAKMLEYAISRLDMSAELIDVIDERYGLNISGMSPSEMMDLVDSALKISCLGGLKHDRNNNMVSLQSKLDGKQVLPWALVLASYFKSTGNEPRIMQQQQSQQGKSMQLMHLRLSKPVV